MSSVRDLVKSIQGEMLRGNITPLRAADCTVQLCECGCGHPSPIAKQAQNGYQRGEAQRFILGHVHPPSAKGRRPTAEQRERMSLAHVGKKAWNAGQRCPQWSGSRNSNWKGGFGTCADCGVPLRSYIAKRCKSCAMKIATNGRMPSQETLEALRLSRVGKPGPFKGKKRPEISGSKCHLWRGGVTPEHQRIRKSVEYKTWRTAVFERDGFKCMECGTVSCRLNADHIKSFARFPALRFEVSNGRTLCVPCHKKTDTYLNRWHIA